MTLASGCGSKTLIRAGAGNLKSLVVMVFLAIAAYMTLKGVFAPWRANGLDTLRWMSARATSDLADARRGAGPRRRCETLASALVAAALAVFIFANRDFRTTGEMIVGGVIIGAVIVGGWYVSGHLGLSRRGSCDAGGEVRRDQFGPHGVVQLCRARSRICWSCCCCGPISRAC